jgi:hypothetical protein
METAPRDGNPVEVKFKNGEEVVAWWDVEKKMWRNDKAFYHHPSCWRRQ